MENWNRRSVLATGAILAVGTGVATAKSKRTGDLPTLGESDGWSSADGGPGNARRVAADTLETPDTVAWRHEGGDEPVVVDGTVYLAGDEIRALDAADGALKWEAAIDGRSLSVTVAGDTVYAGGERLVALDAATGNEEWSTTVGDDDSVSAPLVAFGTAYVLSGGSLYAFDATDGSLRWERGSVDVDGGGPMAFGSRQTQVVATNDSIWAVLEGAGQDGLVELEPATGETRWSGPVDAGTGSLAATDGTLLVQNDSLESVYTFDAERRETEETISDAYVMAIDDGVAVTQGRYDLQSLALDDTGRTAGWTHSGSYTYGLPVIVGDTVVVAHSSPDPGADDAVLGLDLEDGSENWVYEFDDDERWTDGADAGFLVVEDDMVYARRGQDLVAIQPTDWEADDPEGNGDEGETDEDEADDGSDESNGDGNDEDEAYEPGEDDGDGSEDTESTDDGSDGDDDENGDGGNDDGTANGADDAADDDGEGMPGFTTGAGIAGGALGLEWLRRRSTVDQEPQG